ncbi:MAG: FAD-dependent oxidoreductase [Prevotellaceae bacterium]|jgi:ribulose 1,5-bisphosphate synthetase/thiazole synthase|nr:FAD-dependent oxidoreductase [Prevotellaceae bacterium]
MNRNNRRDFVKKAGIMAMAAAAPAFVSGMGNTDKTVSLKKSKISVDDRWDVIVVGGGPGGCTAAISAAREGAKTLLIEATGQLGGMGTSGMVPAWCPFSDREKIIYRGLAEKIFNESRKGVPHERPSKLDWVHINPEHLMTVYDRMVSESGARVLFFSRLASVEMSHSDTVDTLIVANKSGLTAFRAKVYVDATGDGDLAAWAGAAFKRGDGQGVVQSSSLCFSFANVDTYHYENGPRLLPSNPQSPIHAAVDSGKYPLIDRHICNNLIGPGVVQFNAGHLHNVDSTDPWALSDAMMTGRQIAAQYLAAMQERQPQTFGGAFLVRTGSLLGVRDSRRIEGDYIFTLEDWMQRRSFDDEIGRNCYYIDVHKQRDAEPPQYGKGESHGIPYRCLTPRGLKNVLTAGRCISTDEEAFGSLRVMPPCLVTGEAAGMAAVHAIRQSKNNVHGIDVQFLRKRLKEEGQYFL